MKKWFFVAAACASVGCGDSGTRGIGQPDGTAGDTAGEVADTGGDAEVAPDETSDGAGDGTGPVALPNACDAGQSCRSGTTCRSGVCVADPPSGAVSHVTDPVTNQATDGWPALGCVDQTVPAPEETMTATLYGAVARFGKGRKTVGIHVDVLLMDDFDPSACQDEPNADAIKACYRAYGTPVGSAVSVAATPSEVPEECEWHDGCPLGYQCYDPNELGGRCEEQFGLYEIADVPLLTPLVIRAYATSNEAQWHDTWVFNVVLFPDRVGSDGRVQYDAQMVSEGQWILTSNSVGLPDIADENGAIGGRIRDCHDGARDSWPIGDVRLGLAAPGRSFVYFNDLEDDTVPLIDRETTDILGRFAALDVPAGWNRIAGAARVDGQVVTIGSVPVYVAPGALSIISWPGLLPYWRQR